MDKVFGRCLESWISVQSVTWESVRIRFGLPSFPGTVKATLFAEGREIRSETDNGNNAAGFFVFEGLEPDTEYTYAVTAGEETFQETFRTLAKPKGERIFRMAILADPHLSCRSTEDKGRLQSSSGEIVKLMLAQIVERGTELVLSPGDVTDVGWPAEYALASKVLKDFPLPFFATPGNHDIHKDEEHIFLKMFGNGAWLRQLHGYQLAALDTSDGLLDKPWNRDVVNAISTTQPLLLFTHYQIYPDTWIPDENRVISDADSPGCAEMIFKLSQCRGIFYIGHKNVPTQVKVNRVVQLNTPQPTHFPAGYLEVDFYEDGIWHRFIPLFSEAMNEYSRLGTEHSKPHSRPGCTCRSEYRDHLTGTLWNQIIRL